MKQKFLTVAALWMALLFCFSMPVSASSGNITWGSRGTQVKILQMNLNGLGYQSGTADGIAGSKTISAIRKFQEQADDNPLVEISSLAVDGIAGRQTQEALHTLVKTVQQRLNELGYQAGTADGIFGSATAAAVRRFQTAKGLTADGIAGSKTLKALAGQQTGTGNITTSSSLADFQAYALKNWTRPIKSSILTVTGGRRFGASRSGGRLHAGIDWYVSNGAGTPVYAMASGTVVEYSYNTFYGGTGMVAIRHEDGSVARYGEILPGVRLGVKVSQGQKIGTLKANTIDGGTMLHLELYRGIASGSLTVSGNSSYAYLAKGLYNRRRDLLNPTFLLNLK